VAAAALTLVAPAAAQKRARGNLPPKAAPAAGSKNQPAAGSNNPMRALPSVGNEFANPWAFSLDFSQLDLRQGP